MKHSCQKWFDEAIGCSICRNLLLKSPIRNKEDLEEVINKTNWHINTLTKEIEELYEKIDKIKEILRDI